MNERTCLCQEIRSMNFTDPKIEVRLGIRKRVADHWPHHRIVLAIGDDVAMLTPNHARRLRDALEERIGQAEARDDA